MVKRRKTLTIKVGGVKIGSRFPVSIQSMTKTKTHDAEKTIAQIRRLEKAGCEIVRIAVKDSKDAEAIKKIKRRINIPLVADIHFDWRLALLSIKNGADKIRVNPGNISNPNHLKEIIKSARKRKIPIRIGINSGSLPRAISERHPRRTTKLVAFARKYINFFEKNRFRDIIISLKSSDIPETVNAYRKLAALCNYPFHLGITAAGTPDNGIVKSSIGIGSLLLDGIGDTIRVSLTGDPAEEIIAAKRILRALQLRNFGSDIISCPMCGRCQVDLAKIVGDLEHKLIAYGLQFTAKRPTTIALMGCEVNGPGEAGDADIGIAFGKNSGVLFKKGKIIKNIKPKDAVKELIKNL
ncbi:MAG: flavodoxin-dependent (E)-4-hydroxy-3-methylbut-2-enyl-diphosphate synthase [Candidatus Omnitrophica bacterium]|nr:flavodoxin-dependent (E)-4-hydroxy-3-methylbut-2-enyl-diphosphate synthase [Candidatus Omnitrophota bacterium]